RKNATVINFAQSELRSVFRAPSRKFKILAIPDVLAHGKSYEHGFMKKRDDHKLCAESSFDRFFVHHLGNLKYWFFSILLAHGKSYKHVFAKKYHSHKHCSKSRAESIDFSCTSRKFKILVFPVLLAHWKSYKHAFAKNYNGHKLCAMSRTKSSFDRFFMHRVENSKYWPFTMY
ncbi:hypothetical protein BHE74_00050054, partial [Ensete ventricosum]